MRAQNLIKTCVASNNNRLLYSEVHVLEFMHEKPTAAIGIKYVLSGAEHYTRNGKTSSVRNGSFLLLNAGQSFGLEIKSSTTAITGMCVYLDPLLLNEVYQYYGHETSGNHELIERIYDPSDPLAIYLYRLITTIRSEKTVADERVFYSVAEQLFFSQQMARKEMLQLKAMKSATRIELYKRLHYAREILTDPSAQQLSIRQVASSVALSQYHFFRSFRQLFGTSPHRYHAQQKLALAKEKLLQHDQTVTEIALTSGYPDLPSFTKAFKKQFGTTPGRFRYQ